VDLFKVQYPYKLNFGYRFEEMGWRTSPSDRHRNSIKSRLCAL